MRCRALGLLLTTAAFAHAAYTWDYSGLGPYYSVNDGWTYMNGWTANGDISFSAWGQALWPNTV